MKKYKEEILQRLEEVREEKGLKKKEMARELGIPDTTYSKYLHGSYEGIKDNYWYRFMKYLQKEGKGVTITQIQQSNSTIVSKDNGKRFWIFNEDTEEAAYVPPQAGDILIEARDKDD